MSSDARTAWRNPKAPKDILLEIGAPLDSNSLYRLLELAGLVVMREYISATGSGEIKTFRQLTAEGLLYGVNKPGVHAFKTECRFYGETFGDLLQIAAKSLVDYTSDIPDQAPPRRALRLE